MTIFPNDLQAQLVKYTCEHSNFDVSRDYISMSHANLMPSDIAEQYINGFKDDIYIRMKCYKGYQMEKDLVERITAIYGKQRVTKGYEITYFFKDFSVLTKGHPDFLFDGYPCDVKSVLRDEWIPQDKYVPKKVFLQMQSYMSYMSVDMSMVIYESRESGLIKVFVIPAQKVTQLSIQDNFRKAAELIHARLEKNKREYAQGLGEVFNTVVNQ